MVCGMWRGVVARSTELRYSHPLAAARTDLGLGFFLLTFPGRRRAWQPSAGLAGMQSYVFWLPGSASPQSTVCLT